MQKNGGVSAYLNAGNNDEDHYEHIKEFVISRLKKDRRELWRLTKSFEDLRIEYKPLPDRVISDFWLTVDSKTMCAFLQGLYSANGSVIKSAQRVALKSTNRELVGRVQIMLSALGIKSYITTTKARDIKWKNGTYHSRESYDINITSDVLLFKEKIGFTQKYKMEAIKDTRKKGTTKKADIVAVEYLGDMEVFDFTVSADEHMVWQNGLCISNCGELPLPIMSACCLGSINISNFCENGKFDTKAFKKAIEVGVRFLDNVITINAYPLKQIELNATSDRRIGLGLMGLHYAMLKMGIRYSSEEGIAFTERVYEILRNHSYWTSTEIAKEKGSFEKFVPEHYLKTNFVKSLPTKLRDKIRQDGIRNVTLNTQAPSGTTSILAEVSSGIEPIFAPVYERQYYSGDERKKEIIADALFEKFKSEGKDTSHFEGSHDIAPEAHLQIQEAAQRYIDSAISKTINLPEDYPQEKLSDLLLKYIPRLKGVTVYREGSRGESPLRPVSKREYKNRCKDAEDIAKDVKCSSGTCEI